MTLIINPIYKQSLDIKKILLIVLFVSMILETFSQQTEFKAIEIHSTLGRKHNFGPGDTYNYFRTTAYDFDKQGFAIREFDNRILKFNEQLKLEWVCNFSKDAIPKKLNMDYQNVVLLNYEENTYAIRFEERNGKKTIFSALKFGQNGEIANSVASEPFKKDKIIGNYANANGVNELSFTIEDHLLTYNLALFDAKSSTFKMLTIELPTTKSEISDFEDSGISYKWRGWKFLTVRNGNAVFTKCNFDESGKLVLETIEINEKNKPVNYKKVISRSGVSNMAGYLSPIQEYDNKTGSIVISSLYSTVENKNKWAGSWITSYDFITDRKDLEIKTNSFSEISNEYGQFEISAAPPNGYYYDPVNHISIYMHVKLGIEKISYISTVDLDGKIGSIYTYKPDNNFILNFKNYQFVSNTKLIYSNKNKPKLSFFDVLINREFWFPKKNDVLCGVIEMDNATYFLKLEQINSVYVAYKITK